ncbi:cysteine synthase [Mucilaginibacter sp. PPCGB 2223]|uniref:PLP-dependent cysteine synthase family protein n=1 Tax=Mucilaginibacter sp. PPCGB 2223 TaxID=1886027 RepID=UPI0008255037|nr:cysteine synthase family protein [Mucilaginibacter sp. PPCGB 2223]OCX51716.1 cysteine synthase [Mucilaginibacter sp. PPCGB 2223]
MQTHTITNTVGNTPLVKLQNIVPAGCADIYVKLEYFNPTGAYKDRMALAIIEGAEKRGELRPGMTVIECTAGGTGLAMALVCTAKGYKFKAITSDAFAKEKRDSLRIFGAEVELIQSEGGKITPDLVPRMIEYTKKLSEDPNYYWTKQFENTDAFKGYNNLGREILAQLNAPVHVFCAAQGTGGMITGTSQVLKQADPDTRVIVLEPESAPLLSKGIKGAHSVDGIGSGFIPPLLQYCNYNEAQTVDEAEARKMARLLAAKEGILGGTSTGLNVYAAIRIGKELGPGHNVVTVACDSGMKYMSGGLFEG